MNVTPEALMYCPPQQPMAYGIPASMKQPSISMMPNPLMMIDQEQYPPGRVPEAITSANRMKAMQQMATQGYLSTSQSYAETN
jgi:hypothetical protein